ncbi:MAG: replicative helicase loader/inhibitor [Halanaerobiales bacterium]
MKKTELTKLFKYLHSYYQKKFEIPTETADLDLMINTWHDFLKDYQYREVEIVVRKLITFKKWPPVPGEIAQEIEKIKAPESARMTPGEAWEKVIRAIQIHGVLYGTENAQKYLNNINPRIMRAVNNVGGLMTIGRSEENNSYLADRFCREYKEISAETNEYERLPQSIRQDTQKLADYYRNPQIEGGKN